MKAAQGDPLPEVFSALTARDIRLYRGEVTMIAGQPNAGKSLIALAYCDALSEQGEHALYFSADSNEHTQATRLAAMRSGHRIQDVRNALESGGLSYYEDVLSESNIRFDFNSNPTLDDIDLELAAYEELFGRYPSVIVIDNLMNVEGVADGGDNEKHGLVMIQKTLKWICRQTNAAILVLHHCSEAEGKPNMPPPRKMIQQKINELPEMQITVAYDETTNQFGMAGVKNRHGKADPGAKNPVWLIADMDRGRFFSSRYDAIAGGMSF